MGAGGQGTTLKRPPASLTKLPIGVSWGKSTMIYLYLVRFRLAHLPQDTPMGSLVKLAGGRFKVVPCPPAPSIGNSLPICINELVMMPKSRAESLGHLSGSSSGDIVTPPARRHRDVRKSSGSPWEPAIRGPRSISPRSNSNSSVRAATSPTRQ